MHYYFLFVLKAKIEDNKELINTTINTILNRKNEFKIERIDDNAIQVEIEDVIIETKFDSINLSASVSVDIPL